MAAQDTFPNHNAEWAASFNKGHLTLGQPTKKMVIVACMDTRIDPAKQLGIDLGEALVIRNAGASTREALRSIVISQRLLGVREVAVVHHTDCGQFTFTNESITEQVKSEAKGNSTITKAVDDLQFLNYYSNVDESVTGDVKFLKESPLLVEGTLITGWVYDVYTGKVMSLVVHSLIVRA
ncbi:hypothetical protein CVT26_006960 [Gymnopilus dilepis]|uniref:Carbonic anhydrase n=1 Tax=Gymnopilus dilepis TaxID=231916 RepID=A0A409W685_9AGAR|nr:hypothetical protein CVT26_006960 [Gymnopilus dilepis]